MIFAILGIISLIFGLLFIFFPELLLRIGEIFNRIFFTDNIVLKYRVGIGICFFLASLIMVIAGLYK
jgi:hypothetical protein